MYKLHLKLKSYYETLLKQNTDDNRTYSIIYDSYLTPGEGEHKILQHLKLNTKLNNDCAIVIYGLDADLIFLSMASTIPNIYLLREADQFTRNDDNEQDNELSIEEELCYADIDFVKNSINNEFNFYYNKYLLDNNQINKSQMFGDKNENNNSDEKSNDNTCNFDFTNDYIFVCYFLGNDFLPHCPSIDIYFDGLDVMFNTYMDIFLSFGKCMISFKLIIVLFTIGN